MNKPRIQVDFNKMPMQDEVLLSRSDVTRDAQRNEVVLTERMQVVACCADPDEHGNPDNLIAEGIALRDQHGGWTSEAKWLLRIDEPGVRREPEAAGLGPLGNG
jgi:hypothetical protein